MRKKVLFAFVAILYVSLPFLQGEAAAGRHNFVNAVFTNTDPSQCIRTETFILAHSGRFDSSPVMFIRVIQSDDCAEKLIMDAEGSMRFTADSVILDEKLRTAAINTTVRVVDKISRKTFPLDISLNWVGIESPVHTNDSFYFKTPGKIASEKGNFTAVHCNARASGGVYRGEVNLTPRSSDDAEIIWFTKAN